MDNNILENTSSEQETELTTLNQSSNQASEFQDSTTPDGLLNGGQREKQDMSSDPSGQAPSLFTGGDMVILQPSCAAAENEQPPATRPPPSLPTELSQLAHSGVQGLCSNESIAVSACKIYKDDSVVLVVFITNKSTSAIKDIIVRFAPTELKVRYHTHNVLGLKGLLVYLKCIQISTNSVCGYIYVRNNMHIPRLPLFRSIDLTQLYFRDLVL